MYKMDIAQKDRDQPQNIKNPVYFKKLFENYYPSLVNFALKIIHSSDEAKDVVQQFFIRFWENQDKYENREFNKTFFYTSIKNACINHLEKKVNDKRLHTPVIPEIEEMDFFEQIVANEREMELYKIINNLPPRCKEIFYLNRFENQTYKQIAENLNISQKTVEAHMSTALNKLRTDFNPETA